MKYDELLRRCQQADGPSHQAAQTPNGPFASSRTRRRRSSAAPSDPAVVLDGQQPEYKALFKEIFTCIQKTKDDLSINRSPFEAIGSA